MTDRPIIFSAPMVRALLAGRKTQTRRVLKPPYGTLEYRPNGTWRPICTKFFRGDRLWVREAFTTDGPIVRYYATDHVHELRKKRPSIHMPRWASRLTLTVTDVRVQRVQDISEADAVAEGVDAVTMEDLHRQAAMSRRGDFAAIWTSLHGPHSWGANPWVVALTFTVQHSNIDAVAPCP